MYLKMDKIFSFSSFSWRSFFSCSWALPILCIRKLSWFTFLLSSITDASRYFSITFFAPSGSGQISALASKGLEIIAQAEIPHRIVSSLTFLIIPFFLFLYVDFLAVKSLIYASFTFCLVMPTIARKKKEKTNNNSQSHFMQYLLSKSSALYKDLTHLFQIKFLESHHCLGFQTKPIWIWA